MQKEASVTYPVHELIRKRWSPVSFSNQAVEEEKVGAILEAAQWAPSSYNEQPWSFILAQSNEEREEFLSFLVPPNVDWAKRAPLLILSVTQLTFEKNGKANRHAYHDVGLATENMVLQAVSMGLIVHQMAGFSVEKARELYKIPETHDPVTAIAIGYMGDVDQMPENLQQRDKSERQRKPISSFAFHGEFGNTYTV